ncbi:MAG: PilZ domain-containing protein [Planctomycetota bacterium]
MNESRREYFRLRYPPGRRPVVWIDGEEYELTELSERGARIICRESTLQIDDLVTGVVLFQDGENVPFEGTLARIEKNEWIIKIQIGISPGRVVQEQQLIARLENA